MFVPSMWTSGLKMPFSKSINLWSWSSFHLHLFRNRTYKQIAALSLFLRFMNMPLYLELTDKPLIPHNPTGLPLPKHSLTERLFGGYNWVYGLSHLYIYPNIYTHIYNTQNRTYTLGIGSAWFMFTSLLLKIMGLYGSRTFNINGNFPFHKMFFRLLKCS